MTLHADHRKLILVGTITTSVTILMFTLAMLEYEGGVPNRNPFWDLVPLRRQYYLVNVVVFCSTPESVCAPSFLATSSAPTSLLSGGSSIAAVR